MRSDRFHYRETNGRIAFFEFQHPLLDHFLIAFSTRKGGVSQPPYSGLNVGFLVGDDPGDVLENRLRLFKALGVGTDVVVPAQVHGVSTFVAREEEAGRGFFEASTAIPATDSLLTDRPGLALMCLFADCVPVAIADPVCQAVAVVHSGWRGTSLGIVGRAVGTMETEFGSRPSELIAAIGPAIRSCCYSVGDDVISTLSPPLEGIASRTKNGKWSLDLVEANRRRLIDAGLREENVFSLGLCTSCDPELFFSHRRDGGRTGRMAAVVCIKPSPMGG